MCPHTSNSQKQQRIVEVEENFNQNSNKVQLTGPNSGQREEGLMFIKP